MAHITIPPPAPGTGAGDDRPFPEPPRRTPRQQRRRRLVAIAVAACVLLVAAVIALWQGGDDDTSTGPSTTTTEEPVATTAAPEPTSGPTTVAPTTAPPTSDIVTTPPAVDTTTAVFPFASDGVRYDDPVDAARAFATDYVGMSSPIVGEFMAGDSRSGEVEVRAMADGAVTTVFVRQLGADDSWWVLGSATAGMVVEQPSAGALVSSPATVSGQGRGFEGRIVVEVRQDGSAAPLGTAYGTAGSEGMAPFEVEVDFTAPTSEYGAIVAYGSNGLGEMLEASVLRVRLG